MIAGFVAVTRGRIVARRPRHHALPRPNQRGLGVVFQSYALFPHMTVADNVAFGLRCATCPSAERADARRRRCWSWCISTRIADALPARAVRRPAPARRPRPRAGDRAAGAAARRAALQPRRQAARGDAVRAAPHPAQGRHHHDDGHARPGRGAVDQRPRGGDGGRPRHPDRRALPPLRAPAHEFISGFVGKANLLDGRVARGAARRRGGARRRAAGACRCRRLRRRRARRCCACGRRRCASRDAARGRLAGTVSASASSSAASGSTACDRRSASSMVLRRQRRQRAPVEGTRTSASTGRRRLSRVLRRDEARMSSAADAASRRRRPGALGLPGARCCSPAAGAAAAGADRRAVVQRLRPRHGHQAASFTLAHYAAVLGRPVLLRDLLAHLLDRRADHADLRARSARPRPTSSAACASPWRSIFLLVILAPLLVSVVVRAFGWSMLLGPNGLVNQAVAARGLAAVKMLYTADRGGDRAGARDAAVHGHPGLDLAAEARPGGRERGAVAGRLARSP